jgi:uncharacterized protein YdhG (YjbR/CyaY superfamily)
MDIDRRTHPRADADKGFSAEERAAMKERAKEQKAARSGKTDGEADIRAKLAEMPEPDRSLGERLHALIRETAPDLTPRTWYGMPAYAKDGKVLVFFQAAAKFGARYATLGFNDVAQLDDGPMWPTAYALVDLTDEAEARIRELVRRAVS